MKAKKRMTAQDFEAVRPLLNISDDRIDAARAALVEGQTLQGIANLYGCTRQAVNGSVVAVWKAYEKYTESQRAAASAAVLLPPGHEELRAIVPSPLLPTIRQLIADAVSQYNSEQNKTEPKKATGRKGQ